MTKEKHNPFSEDNFNKENEENTVNEAIEEKTEEVSENKTEVNEPNGDKIQQELDDVKNQYIRLAADFDNYRKRQAQERESLLKYGAEETLKLLLPVIDTFERAQKSLKGVDDVQTVKDSFDVIEKQLFEALTKAGLTKMETEGKEFNPNEHEAVMQTPTTEHVDHTVINELQTGYKLGDKVLRAAMVNVAVNEG